MSLDTGRWEENSSQHNNMKSSIVVLDGSTIGGHHGSSNNTSGVGGGDGSRHRCTKHERNLTLLVILLSVLCFGLLVYLFVSGPLASLLIPVWQIMALYGLVVVKEYCNSFAPPCSIFNLRFICYCCFTLALFHSLPVVSFTDEHISFIFIVYITLFFLFDWFTIQFLGFLFL
jgi:hypothetical protein